LFGHSNDSIIAFPHFLIALLAFNDSDEPALQNTPRKWQHLVWLCRIFP
jgi:hypothetical protein